MVKDTQHEIYHFDHFKVDCSVTLSPLHCWTTIHLQNFSISQN